MIKQWTKLELFWIHTGQFDIKYLKLPISFTTKLLRTTVLRNRSIEAIRKKLKSNV